jgi:hypothetical protein
MMPKDSAMIYATYRVLARALQLSGARRQDRRGWRLTALGASVVCDAFLWRAIRRESVSFATRVGIDLADLALWAGPGRSDLTVAICTQVPADVEAGVAYGPAGFALPIISTGVSSVSRLLCGERPDPSAHIPHAGAVIGGIAVRHVERQRMNRAREVHAAELSAKAVRAFLAGQNEMAMGVSSIIDQLKPVAMLLESDAPGSVLNQVRAGWKDSLAEQTQQHAVFLDSAIRLWQQLHNDHPDLRGYVDFVNVAEGDGTTLVTGYQAGQLAQLLEARDLGETVRIEVVRRETRATRPGRALDLRIDGEILTVPADPSARVDRFNPAPPAFFFGAWAALMPTRPSDGSLPLPLALACSAGYLAAGLRYFGRAPDDTAKEALLTGLALSAFQGTVCAAGCQVRRRDSGAHMFHGTYGIAPAGLLFAASRLYLSAGERRAALVLMGAVGAMSYLVAERPRSLVDLGTAMAHPVAAMIGMSAFAGAAARETERVAAELRLEDEDTEVASFGEGQRHVLHLAAAALAEAEAAFAQHTDLDPPVRESVAARLATIRELAVRLAARADSLPA